MSERLDQPLLFEFVSQGCDPGLDVSTFVQDAECGFGSAMLNLLAVFKAFRKIVKDAIGFGAIWKLFEPFEDKGQHFSDILVNQDFPINLCKTS
jgi:hypothetical protein